MDLTASLEPIANVGTYASLLIVVGVCAARWAILPGVQTDVPVIVVASVERWWAKLGLGMSALLVASLLVRAWAHTATAFGLSDSFSTSNLHLIAIESRWGTAWRIQLLGALALVAASAWNLTCRPASWLAVTLVCIGFCVALPLMGHAAGSDARILLLAVHVLGAGLWLGTLIVLFLTPRFDRAAGLSSSKTVTLRVHLLRRFSPVAATGTTVGMAAGLTAAVVYVGSMANLWRTSYGRVLALKVVLVMCAACCGYFNWRALRRYRGADGSSDEPPAVIVEVGLAIAVVFLTAFLTELDHL